MKLKPKLTNKDGLITKVFDPARNQFHEDDAVIDLDTLDLDMQMYYQRILAEGDLVEIVDEVKPSKKEQPATNGDK